MVEQTDEQIPRLKTTRIVIIFYETDKTRKMAQKYSMHRHTPSTDLFRHIYTVDFVEFQERTKLEILLYEK